MSRGRRPPQGLGKEGGEGWGQPSDSQRNRGGGQGEAPEASTSWQVPWPGVLASSPAVGQQLRRGGPLGLSSGGCCGIEGTVLSPCLRRCPPPCLLCPLTRVPQGCSWGSWRCLRRLSLRRLDGWARRWLHVTSWSWLGGLGPVPTHTRVPSPSQCRGRAGQARASLPRRWGLQRRIHGPISSCKVDEEP